MSERFNIKVSPEQKIQDIFRQSYFLSQGRPKLQSMLFEWIGVKNLVTLEDFKDISVQWLAKFVSPKSHDAEGYLGSKMQKTDPWVQFDNFKNKINLVVINRNNDQEKITIDILDSMLEADILYQILKRPNRTISNGAEADTVQDPHKSYIRHYVVCDNYKLQPFNNLFEEFKTMNLQNLFNPHFNVPQKDRFDDSSGDNRSSVREAITLWTASLYLSEKLTILTKLWEQNHPGEKFFN